MDKSFSRAKRHGWQLKKVWAILAKKTYHTAQKAPKPASSEERWQKYLERHTKLGRYFQFHRQFQGVALLLGSFLLVCGVFTAAAYYSVNTGAVSDALNNAALPAIVDHSENNDSISEKMLWHSVFFPDNTSVGYLFQDKEKLLLSTDWEDEENSALPSVGGLNPENLDAQSLYYFDRSQIPKGEYGIFPMDLCAGMDVINNCDYEIDLPAYAQRDYPLNAVTSSSNAPTVLVLHTHATESYAPSGAKSYDPQADETRSTDSAQNMIAVGNALTASLESQGISVLHLTEQFDAQSYTDSYTRAAEAIVETLAKYPSITYVFDVHRDSMVRSNGDKVRPVTLIDAKPCAQVMLVVGTDCAGGAHPYWQDNLTVAAHLQQKLISRFGTLVRPVNMRSATFNEQYTKGSLLIEIGTTGNSLSEATNAASALGQVLGEMIRYGG